MIRHYPEFTNTEFYKKLFIKKEFHKYYDGNKSNGNKSNGNKSNGNKSNGKKLDFELQPQQSLLKKYISMNTPYNSVLVFHGTGVGKTCTAINIAENFKKKLHKSNKKILVILPRSIRSNFIKELYNISRPDTQQCIGTIYKYDSSYSKMSNEKKAYYVRANIKKYYQFYGYEQFANNILKMASTKWDGTSKTATYEIKKLIEKKYSNRVIIIDEIHHLKSTKDSLIKKVPPILESIVSFGKNIKLVLMSATPMYDSPREIIYLLNLMLLNDNRHSINENDVFDKNNNLTKKGGEILKKASIGYISYYRGENPAVFPYRIYSKGSFIPSFKYNIKGHKINDKLQYLKVFPTYFTKDHYNYYKSIVGDSESIDNVINNNEKGTDERDVKKNIVMTLQQISNIIYPVKNKNKFTHGSKGFQVHNNGNGAFYNTRAKIGKKTIKYFKYQDHVIYDKDTPNEKPFLDISILKIVSPKISSVINQIINSKGISYVYSEYVDGGAMPVALALEQAGYERITLHNETQLLDYSKNKNGGGGKSQPRCYLCGKNIKDHAHSPNNKSGHRFKVGKYVIIAGSLMDNKNIVQEYINVLNSPDNIDGGLIKVIIGTRVTGEGVDMTGIRQIHILEPWWNLSRLEQIIGRGIRYKSHMHLDEKNRNVELFQYVVLPPTTSSQKEKDTETIDVYTYKKAEIKDIHIKEVEYLIKQMAIDCNFFKKNNERIKNKIVKQITSSGEEVELKIGDQPYSRECSYMKHCNYDCSWSPKTMPTEINNDTYSINYSVDEIQSAIKYIINIFKTGYIFNLETIYNYVIKFKNMQKIFVYYGLNKLIQNKKRVLDKFRKNGTIIYKGDYYIFQPDEIANKDVPMYYRSLIRKLKTNNIKINIENINNTSNTIDISNYIREINKKYSIYMNNMKYYGYKQVNENIILSMILDEYPLSILINLYKKKDINKLLIKYFRIKSHLSGFIIQKEEILPVYTDDNDDIGDIYGIITKNNKKGVFKFIDLTKSKNNLTIGQKKSKRSVMKGRVCATYDIYVLKDIVKRLNNGLFKTDIGKVKKEIFCFMIEYILRYNELNSVNGKQWLLYKK